MHGREEPGERFALSLNLLISPVPVFVCSRKLK
jgi:hypothetical protein